MTSWDDETKTLTINGNGVLEIQWPHRDDAKIIILSEGITELVANCIYSYKQVEYIYFPKSLVKLNDNSIADTKLKLLNITENLTEISSGNPWDLNLYIEKVIVDPKHPFLTTINNVLYSKDKKILYYFPSNYNISYYWIEHGVTRIAWGAFCNNQHLEYLFIPLTVTTINGYFFSFNKKAKLIVWEQCNNKYKYQIDTSQLFGGREDETSLQYEKLSRLYTCKYNVKANFLLALLKVEFVNLIL